jgi:hypothetical protein
MSGSPPVRRILSTPDCTNALRVPLSSLSRQSSKVRGAGAGVEAWKRELAVCVCARASVIAAGPSRGGLAGQHSEAKRKISGVVSSFGSGCREWRFHNTQESTSWHRHGRGRCAGCHKRSWWTNTARLDRRHLPACSTCIAGCSARIVRCANSYAGGRMNPRDAGLQLPIARAAGVPWADAVRRGTRTWSVGRGGRASCSQAS